ncbi:MAG: hypothetical protein ACLGIR_01245 [Actinomycetes bacterium]
MLRRTTATLAVAALAFTTLAAEDDAPTVELTADAVTTDAGTLEVSGSLSFGGSLLVLDDAVGDAAVPGVGHDLDAVTLRQEGQRLRVELALADAIPAVESLPEVTRWVIPLNGSSRPGAELHAWRSSAFNSAVGQADPAQVFTSLDFDGDGGFETEPVDGGLAGGVLFWDAPISTLGHLPGDQLFLSAASQPGAAGFFKVFLDFDSATGNTEFTLGGLVTATLTAEDGSTVTRTGVALADGTWALSFGEVAPGAYTLTTSSGYADVAAEVTTDVVVEAPATE